MIGIDSKYLSTGYSHYRFDSIDYAEAKVECVVFGKPKCITTHVKTKKQWQWQVGSEGGSRYQEFGGINEFESILPIHLVLVFDYANNFITMYRNGFKYGNPYSKPVVALSQGVRFFTFVFKNRTNKQK